MSASLLEQADFLKRLFDAVPSLMFIVDDDVRIINVNAAAVKFAQEEKQSAIHQKGGDFLHCVHALESPEGCGRSPHCAECIIRRSVGRSFRREGVYRETFRVNLLTSDKVSEVYFMVTTAPVHYQGRQLVLLIMEDITEQKKYEEALRHRSAQLEASYKDMESFTYSASHDLRSPLIAISGFSRVLLEDHGEKFDDEVKELLGIIVKNAARMEQLIMDLLRFSRVSSKDVEMSDDVIDMSALVEESYEELAPVMGKRKIDLEIKHLLPAVGDRSMLRQVLVNLLSNAIKYTGCVESAKIEVGCVKQGIELIYYVKDNGVGFDPKYAGKLFGLFSRLHGVNEFEGTGVGLAIIKRIIEKHCGRVWADGSPNEGATFYFSLPLPGKLPVT